MVLQESQFENPISFEEERKKINEMGGYQELMKSVDELPELLKRNEDILSEIENMLIEEKSDIFIKKKFGFR